MSQWMKIKTKIKNLDSFKLACSDHNVGYEDTLGAGKRVAILTDLQEGGPTYSRTANVCRQEDYYYIHGDTDSRYSSLAARLGKNYDMLMQSYARHEILNNLQSSGGMLVDEKRNQDGSLVMRVSV